MNRLNDLLRSIVPTDLETAELLAVIAILTPVAARTSQVQPSRSPTLKIVSSLAREMNDCRAGISAATGSDGDLTELKQV